MLAVPLPAWRPDSNADPHLAQLPMNAAPPAQRGNVMTDAGVPGRDPSAASAPAAAWVPATGQNPVTEHGPVTSQGPVTGAPRRRRRWAVVVLVAVVVLGLAAALKVWAPRNSAPVLRPAGLVAVPATANSIAFRWSRPPTGPLPDKYLILSNGTVAGSAPGTATSYRQAGLTPATAYQYRVVAVRGGKRSSPSALVTVRTLTPPISQARLQGAWNIYAKNTSPAHGGRNGSLFWQVSPACAVGPCNVRVHEKDGRHSMKLKLTRAGATYRGRAVVNYYPCGPTGSSIPDPTTVKFRIRVTGAAGQNQVWAASSLTGTMVGTSRYVSSATFYCPAVTFKASLTGTPT
jgi:hypothetical protein